MTHQNKDQAPGTQCSAHPFKLSVEQLVQQLNTNTETGLNKATAADVLSKYGENKLQSDGGVKWHTVLLKQMSNAMILVIYCPYHECRSTTLTYARYSSWRWQSLMEFKIGSKPVSSLL